MRFTSNALLTKLVATGFMQKFKLLVLISPSMPQPYMLCFSILTCIANIEGAKLFNQLWDGLVLPLGKFGSRLGHTTAFVVQLWHSGVVRECKKLVLPKVQNSLAQTVIMRIIGAVLYFQKLGDGVDFLEHESCQTPSSAPDKVKLIQKVKLNTFKAPYTWVSKKNWTYTRQPLLHILCSVF